MLFNCSVLAAELADRADDLDRSRKVSPAPCWPSCETVGYTAQSEMQMLSCSQLDLHAFVPAELYTRACLRDVRRERLKEGS